MSTRILIVAAALAASTTAIAAAGGAPVLNVEKTCRAAEPLLGANTPGNGAKPDATRPYRDCMASENAARTRAATLWPKAKAADRDTCFGLSKIVYPSYVELAACLEMYQPIPVVTAPAANTGQKAPTGATGDAQPR
jgi:hypothetical protein